MLRREGLRSFAARAGSAGLLAGMLAATAGASLPTGGMLLPKPKGPARSDLPASTSISVYRVPSATAYGISDVNKSYSGRDFSAIAAAEPARRHVGRRINPVALDPVAPDPEGLDVATDNVARANAVAVDATPVEVQPLIRPRSVAHDVALEFGTLQPTGEAQLQPNPFDGTQIVQPATFTDLRPAEAQQTTDEGDAQVFAGLKGICPVTLYEERRVVTPRVELFTIAQGCRFEFATPDAKAMFDAEPERYIPVMNGRDVVLATTGGDQDVGSLRHSGIYRGRLYLFRTAESCRVFCEHPQHFAGDR